MSASISLVLILITRVASVHHILQTRHSFVLFACYTPRASMSL